MLDGTYADGLTFECNLGFGKFDLEGTPTIAKCREVSQHDNKTERACQRDRLSLSFIEGMPDILIRELCKIVLREGRFGIAPLSRRHTHMAHKGHVEGLTALVAASKANLLN